MSDIQPRHLHEVRYTPADADKPVEVKLTLPRREVAKLDAFLSSGTWEKAQAARNAQLEQCPQSLAVLLNTARRHIGTSGGRVCATVLASLYNGERVKLDLSDLKLLDQHLFEHAMNAIRLCVETMTEPHQYFQNGGQIFEELIADWGLEKKRRNRR